MYSKNWNDPPHDNQTFSVCLFVSLSRLLSICIYVYLYVSK